MMNLPLDVQTTMLKSFWIVFCFVFGVLATLFIYIFLEPYAAFLTLLFIPVMIYPGYMHPDKISGFYRLMSRVSLKLNRIVQKLLLYIIHYLFLFSYKLSDRDNYFNLKDSSVDSMWCHKVIQNLTGEDKQNDVSCDGKESWLRTYLRWIMKSNKFWMLPLIPFMLIISMTTDNKISKSVDHDTYTLY